MNEAGNAIGF